MRVLILGAGPAGVVAAERLRALAPARGVRLDITMVSAEQYPPYAPPTMADHFIHGGEERLFWRGRDIGQRLELNYLSGSRAQGIDTERRRVLLDDDRKLGYDRLIIATGSRLYAPLRGYDLPGVYNFKSLSAARSLVEQVHAGTVGSAIVVGAGFIGVEVALLLADLGVSVLMLEKKDRVMPRVLDRETAGIVLKALRDRGIEVETGVEVGSFRGRRKVKGLRLQNGDRIKADAYVAATGVKPNIEFLEGSKVETDWGVIVDQTLSTNMPGIWAAGDVAETRDRLSGERYVHAIWPNAVAQGAVVAERMLGYDISYAGSESMNSLRHLGIPLIAAGASSGRETLRLARDGWLRKIFLDDGRITGYRLAGNIGGAGVYRSLMLRGVDVQDFGTELVEPDFGIGKLSAIAPEMAARPQAPAGAYRLG